jgi:hypothetical protein
MEKVLEPLFWPGIVATTLRIAEGFGEPSPFVPARVSCSAQMLTLVPFEPMVSPPLYLRRLHALHFLGHPQPWSVRGCAGYFELAAPPWFGCPFPAQKAQSASPGCLCLDQSVAGSALVLRGLDQRLMVSAQATPGLFLGVISLLSLGDRAASALDLWFGVDWWFLGVATGVVVMGGAQ